ncbi:MAG: rRNA maturation RNase YbeY [Verrucomicrobiota bacterium]
MNRVLNIQNRQREVLVQTRALRRAALVLLDDLLPLRAYEVNVRLVGSQSMARWNHRLLAHEGPTDVISLSYRPPAPHPGGTSSRQSLLNSPRVLHGELLICPRVAVEQARQFRVSWPLELVRYLAHGLLHLLDFDDCEPAARRRMKREENRLVRELARRCPIGSIAGRVRGTAR